MTQCSNRRRPHLLGQTTRCLTPSSTHSVMDGLRSLTTAKTQACCILRPRIKNIVTDLTRTTASITTYQTVQPHTRSTPWVVSTIHLLHLEVPFFHTRVTMLGLRIMDASFQTLVKILSSSSNKKLQSLAQLQTTQERHTRFSSHNQHRSRNRHYRTSSIALTI